MQKNNFYITFGIWVAILPFLGIPLAWKASLVSLSGIFLVLISIGPIILKKLDTKPKIAKKRIPKSVTKSADSQIVSALVLEDTTKENVVSDVNTLNDSNLTKTGF